MHQAHKEIPVVRLGLTPNDGSEAFTVTVHSSRPRPQGFLDSVAGKVTPEQAAYKKAFRVVNEAIGRMTNSRIDTVSLLGHSFSDVGNPS